MRNGERGKEEEQGEEINLFKNYLRVCVFCLRGCPGALWVAGACRSQESNWIPSIWSY